MATNPDPWAIAAYNYKAEEQESEDPWVMAKANIEKEKLESTLQDMKNPTGFPNVMNASEPLYNLGQTFKKGAAAVSNLIPESLLGLFGAAGVAAGKQKPSDKDYYEATGKKRQTPVSKLEELAEIGKGIISGATAGFSEKYPALLGIPGLAAEQFSQNGLKPNREEYPELAQTSTMAGDFLPTGAGLKYGQKAASAAYKKIPGVRKFAEGLGSLTGSAATGAAKHGLEEVKEGRLPTIEGLSKHAGEWLLLDGAIQAAGQAFRFGKAIHAAATATGKSQEQVAADLANQMFKDGKMNPSDPKTIDVAMNILEKEAKPPRPPGTRALKVEARPTNVSPNAPIVGKEIEGQIAPEAQQAVKPLAGRNIKLNEGKVSPNVPETVPAQIRPQNAESAVTSLADRQIQAKKVEAANPFAKESNLAGRIEKVGKAERNTKAVGERLQRDIGDQKLFAEHEYTPLYNRVRESAGYLIHNGTEAANYAVNTLQRLERLRLQPTGYGQTIRQLESFLEDIGYTLQRDTEGLITGATRAEHAATRISDLHDLSIRLNDIINYESLEKSVKDLLKPLARFVKDEIRQTLSQQAPAAAKLFAKAETKYGETAQKFGRESVQKILKTEATENIPALLRSPSTLADLKAILPAGRYATVERQILEHLNTLKGAEAETAYKEIKEYLSPQSRKLANEIIADKKFLSFAEQVISPSGEINAKKISQLARDPRSAKAIEEIGGKQAVQFFKELEGLDKAAQKNIALAKRIQDPFARVKPVTGQPAGRGEAKIAKTKAANQELGKQAQAERKAIAGKVTNPLAREKPVFGKGKGEATIANKKQANIEIQKTENARRAESAKLVKNPYARESGVKIGGKEAQGKGENMLANRKQVQAERQAAAKRASQPYEAAWEDFLNEMGVTEATALKVLLGLTLGAKKYTAYIASRVLYRLAKRPGAQAAFRSLAEASPLQVAPDLKTLAQSLNEEREED